MREQRVGNVGDEWFAHSLWRQKAVLALAAEQKLSETHRRTRKTQQNECKRSLRPEAGAHTSGSAQTAATLSSSVSRTSILIPLTLTVDETATARIGGSSRRPTGTRRHTYRREAGVLARQAGSVGSRCRSACNAGPRTTGAHARRWRP